MSSDENTEGEPTLSSLTEKLHVPIPVTDVYVFRGPKGTFVINTDRTDPIDEVLDEE